MYLPPIFESANKDKLLTGLGLAIAEAKMVRSLLSRKDTVDRKPEDLKKLVNLEREIDYLETTLFEIRSKDKSDTE